jgi:UDP-N-acetylglucosamine 4,6-dehydratase
MFALENMVGGEIFIPKIPSMKVIDLFKAIAGDCEIEIIGIRPGEKLHEVLLTEQESRHSLELENYYVVLPEFMDLEKYKKYHKIGQKLEQDFRFTSDTNKMWLNHDQFKDYIKKI